MTGFSSKWTVYEIFNKNELILPMLQYSRGKLSADIANIAGVGAEVASLPHEHPGNDWLPDYYICVIDQT